MPGGHPHTPPRNLARERVDHALAFGMQSRVDGPERRYEQAEIIDATLTDIAAELGLPAGCAVAAHGAYGRRDGGPVSPFDVALLWDDSKTAFSSTHAPDDGAFDPQAIAAQLWLALWEVGASFNHCVYSLAQCEVLASLNIDNAVGFLDVRCVGGRGRGRSRAHSGIALVG